MNEDDLAVQFAKEQAPNDMFITPVVVDNAILHKKMNVTGEDLLVHGKRWYVLVELRNVDMVSDEYGTKATALYRVWLEENQFRATRVTLLGGRIDDLEIVYPDEY